MENQLCQSCAMPLSHENRGSNTGGTKNQEYGHFCFEKGAFTNPSLSLEQQIRKLTDMAVTKMNMPRDKGEQLAQRTLPGLKRWA